MATASILSAVPAINTMDPEDLLCYSSDDEATDSQQTDSQQTLLPTTACARRWSGLSGTSDSVIRCHITVSPYTTVPLYMEKIPLTEAISFQYVTTPTAEEVVRQFQMINRIVSLNPELDIQTAVKVEESTRKMALPGDTADPYKLVRLLQVVMQEVCIGSTDGALDIKVSCDTKVSPPNHFYLWAQALCKLQMFILDIIAPCEGDRCSSGDCEYIKRLKRHSGACDVFNCTVPFCGMVSALKKHATQCVGRCPLCMPLKLCLQTARHGMRGNDWMRMAVVHTQTCRLESCRFCMSMW